MSSASEAALGLSALAAHGGDTDSPLDADPYYTGRHEALPFRNRRAQRHVRLD